MEDAGFSGRNDPLTERIIGVFYEVYNELGFGFLESVYREAMRIALGQAGLLVEAEVPVPVSFRGRPVGVFSRRPYCRWASCHRIKDCGVD
jgi:hypothetical protein